MRARMNLSRTTRTFLLGACVGVGVLVTTSKDASAELRKFAVMLAHSPKSQLDGTGQPGLPIGGLHSVEDIRKQYFDRLDPELDSFAEYWEEISYGDVTITGDALGWVTLPWAFDPNAPNGGERASAADFIDLHANQMLTCTAGVNPPVPAPFAYGAGEDFCDCTSSGDIEPTPITSGLCGALIIIDRTGTEGTNLQGNPPPVRGPGLDDRPVAGVAVWTPGERFIDLDDDNRWDGVDEVTDRFCPGPNGCQVPLCSRSRVECKSNEDCPELGEFCVPADPVGGGPRGCNTPGCGDLKMPWIDWDGSDDAEDISGCVIPQWLNGSGQPVGAVSLTTNLLRCGDPLEPPRCQATGTECETDADCDLGDFCQLFENGSCPLIAGYSGQVCPAGYCPPTNCRLPDPNGTLPQLLPCCATQDPDDTTECAEGEPGLTCQDPNSDPFPQCCEFDDSTDTGNIAVAEPFEDFMVRWNPQATNFKDAWIKVTEEYIRNNYPGDVEALVARTGNGIYDPPDLFVDRGSTKMMQDAGLNQFGWITPEPGTFYTSGPPNFEKHWFPEFWTSRYGSTPPPWPGGSGGFIAPNSPVMRPFDPDAPLPPIVQNEDADTVRRWFQPNAGGWDGLGLGMGGDVADHNITFNLGSDDWSEYGRILPDEEFGYYDGWVEHDDLASSKYHHAGDKRLGEITSPTTDKVSYPGVSNPDGTIATYTAIAGADLGQNRPDRIAVRDQRTVAAGPLAINIHGEKGFDAGDVCILEWLTWRTDGTSPTVSAGWEAENGPYHPFAGPSSPRTEGPKGFADYNLDGMIDQGEVRPELSESYSVDSDPRTADDGTDTNYPFNRRRLVEDVVEALDQNVDWDDFVDPNANKRGISNTVSGIVLVPGDSYTDINRFPNAPSFYPVHTEDTGTIRPKFHDLVICQTCRDFPAAIAYAAHEYLHTWEGYPDLYDYDVFDDNGVINCPIGIWDIMERNAPGLVHPTPPLKEELSGWIQSVDLAEVLTPGVVTTITLPPAEKVRDESYYFLANSERPGEREYFWSAGSGMDEGRFPGKGMLILHTQDFTAINNSEALASQQRTTPANFRIVQADGLGELEACSSSGNTGDLGDMWGSIPDGATKYNFDTTPSATWTSQNRWTGIDISDVRPDNFGSVSVTLSLTPTNIPSLKFINPPGGETVGSTFQVRYEATDVFGGTDIELYYTTDPNDLSTGASNRIGSKTKGAPGTIRSSIDWNISAVPDDRYFIFAKLIPGVGADGLESQFTEPRIRRNSVGNGTLHVLGVDVSASSTATARSETWVVTCIDTAGTEWVVYSSLTQPEPDTLIPGPFPHAFTCPENGPCTTPYTSIHGEVTFEIREGSVPFTKDDSFNFTTTGLTAPSAAVEIVEGKISRGPRAVIVADPLTIRPGEEVAFDASESTDPQSLTLAYKWDFGDGSPIAFGETATHVYRGSGTFTVKLTATNSDGLSDDEFIDIVVFNNSPNAEVTATVTSGRAPLSVTFSGTGSSDTESDASDLIFQWDFGDGTTINDQGDPGTFQSATHVFEKNASGVLCTPTAPCTFTVRLDVTDEGGKSDFATVAILVGNSDPIAVVTATPSSGDSPLEVSFDATASSDPDDQAITVTWDFDDGSPTKTGLTALHTYEHTETEAKQYNPTATIEDGFGGVATWTTLIVVAPEPKPNDPPVASFTVTPATLTGQPGDTFSFDASATTDPQPEDVEGLLYKWAFGDGLFGTGIKVTHEYVTANTFQVELTVTDSRGETSIVTKTITITLPENRDPTAIITTGPRSGTAPALLTFDGRNSFDPDTGQTLTFSWTFTGNGEPPDTLEGSVVSRTFQNPGTFDVKLIVTDGNGGEDSATITVTITEAADNSIGGGGGDQPPGRDVPNSANQRPTGGSICGFGMIGGLFGSLFGLSFMAITRGRRRLQR